MRNKTVFIIFQKVFSWEDCKYNIGGVVGVYTSLSVAKQNLPRSYNIHIMYEIQEHKLIRMDQIWDT